MNRSLLLTTALVLMAAPSAHAQAAKRPAPVVAPLDCLKAVRAHAAELRAQPLTLLPSVGHASQAVPLRHLEESSTFSAVARAPSQGAGSGCFR